MNNPPAFPGPSHIPGYGNCTPFSTASGETVWQENHDGMTIRDYFAAKAMQSIMIDPNTSVAKDPSENDDIAMGIARFSYVMADAMLAEREKK